MRSVAKPGAHANSQQSAPMRWVFVGICGLLSLVLAGSMLSNFFGARQLADTVIRGQAAMVFHLLHRYAPPSVRQPSDAEVERAFEAGQDLALRYLALVDRKGAVMEIGESSEDIVFEALPPSEYRLVGDVVRVWAPQGPRPLLEGKGPPPFEGKWGGEGKRPPRFEGKGPPRFEGKGPPPFEGKGPPFGHRPGARFVIEFVPTQAVAMRERAQIDLFVGLGSIVIMWAGAFAFWKLSRRTSVAEAELARRRHLAALGEMSAVIAHELRNPLASLKGHAQLLKEQASDPKTERKATRVVNEAVRLQALTSGLLDFVRSGKVQPEDADVGALTRDATAGTVAVVDADVDCAPRTWTLDRGRMRQVLVNLLDNAHHASPDTAAELTVFEDAGELVFEVRDRGPGVPVEKRDEIFAPFHTGRTQGTGLGLAVSRRIVGEHGGSIVCDEHPDGGALFIVRIP